MKQSYARRSQQSKQCNQGPSVPADGRGGTHPKCPNRSPADDQLKEESKRNSQKKITLGTESKPKANSHPCGYEQDNLGNAS